MPSMQSTTLTIPVFGVQSIKSTLMPSIGPSETLAPTNVPSLKPTFKPTTMKPSAIPSNFPTQKPTNIPSVSPTIDNNIISLSPTMAPTRRRCQGTRRTRIGCSSGTGSSSNSDAAEMNANLIDRLISASLNDTELETYNNRSVYDWNGLFNATMVFYNVTNNGSKTDIDESLDERSEEMDIGMDLDQKASISSFDEDTISFGDNFSYAEFGTAVASEDNNNNLFEMMDENDEYKIITRIFKA